MKDPRTLTYTELVQALQRCYEEDARRDKKHAKLLAIGESAMSAISDMVNALNCDYDRLDELRDERSAHDDGPEQWAAENPDDAEELRELEDAAGDCEDRDDAERRIQEDPLDIEYQGTWSPGDDPEPEQAIILLTTGGPAVRIVAELGRGGVTRAYLQVQNWFTPWTDVPCYADDLLQYCETIGVGAEL